MSWNPTLTNLRDVLASLYLTIQDSRRIIEDAGLNPAYITFENKAINNWHNILREAHHHNKVPAIIDIALSDYPENEWLKLAKKGALSTIKGPDIQKDVTWKGPDDINQLEKIIGTRSTLLPISFLEIGFAKSRSVVRVVRADDSTGSGFLTDNDLLITNHHVLANQSDAQDAFVQFNFQKTSEGLDSKVEELKLAPEDAFATSKTDDWTAVSVQNRPNEKWGAIKLTKVSPKVKDRVNIIQHPGGGAKQIALYHNTLVYVDNKRIQYLTDTLPGSSGSPVFDSDWRVVALHHSGGWLVEPGSKLTYYRNEGIHINAVIEGLITAGISFC